MSLQKLLESIDGYTSCGLIREKTPISARDIALLRDDDLANCSGGCGNYGRHFSCPPYAPKPSEMAKVVNSYSDALLVVLDGRLDRQNETNITMLMLEHDARAAGFSRALAFFAYPCSLCGTCPMTPDERVAECQKPLRMRPTIDTFVKVLKTLENAKQPFRRYAEGEEFDMYSIVLLE